VPGWVLPLSPYPQLAGARLTSHDSYKDEKRHFQAQQSE
jgi:hypothetical protein